MHFDATARHTSRTVHSTAGLDSGSAPINYRQVSAGQDPKPATKSLGLFGNQKVRHFGGCRNPHA